MSNAHKLQLINLIDDKWAEYYCDICGYHTRRNTDIQPGEKRAIVSSLGDPTAFHIIGEGIEATDLSIEGDNLGYRLY